MDTGIIDLIFKVVFAVSQAALFIYVRNTNRNDEVDRRFAHLQEVQEVQAKEVSSQVGAMASRLSHLEAAVEAAPDHDDLSKVYKSINELSELVNQLVGENRGQSDTLRLIVNQIMQKGMGG